MNNFGQATSCQLRRVVEWDRRKVRRKCRKPGKPGLLEGSRWRRYVFEGEDLLYDMRTGGFAS